MGWHVLTPLGNGLLIVPAALLATMVMVWQGGASARAALRWLGWLLLVCATVVASKIAFYGWGTGIRSWNLTCFSGHAALALAFWPVLLPLLAPPERRWLRGLLFGSGIGVGLLVGVSRVMVRAHPSSEVVIGILLGAAAAFAALRGFRGIQVPRGLALVPLFAVLLLWLWDGDRLTLRLPTERWFANAGVALSGHQAPYRRAQWLRGETPEGIQEGR